MSRAPARFAAAIVVVCAPALAAGQVRPEPDVKLALEAPTTRGAWTLRVINDGDVPVRIAADTRTLVLDVTARGARAPIRCELPDDMRPEGDLDNPLVLPPGRSYAHTFEARLYCFGDKRGAALAPGSIVVAHLGWAGRRPSSFEVSPIDGIEPRVTARALLDALPIVLPDEPTPSAPPPRAAGVEDAPALSLLSAEWIDAESASAIEVPVTLRNDGAHAVAVRFRPEALRFDVAGPLGVERCTWPALPGAATRDLFSTLSPRGATELTASLTAYCGSHAFDEPGLYFVRARVDTRGQSGAVVGLRAFEGELVASTVAVVRLHRGRAPKPPARSKLED